MAMGYSIKIKMNLKGFQPYIYKEILMYQASKQARRQISMLIPYGRAR